MAANTSKAEFVEPDSFEWDESKNKQNIAKHGIDFEDAIEIFDDAILLGRSDRNNEERWVAIGKCSNRVIAVIFTRRGETVRIISARSARKNEKESYHKASSRRPAKGTD